MNKKKTFVPESGEILDLLVKANRPLNLDDVLRHSGVQRRAKKEVQEILFSLADKGDILRLRGGAFIPKSMAKTVTGRYFVQRSGAAFVTPDSSKNPLGDIYIHPGMGGDAWHGDLVRVAVLPGRRGKNSEGRVVEVLERQVTQLAAHVTAIHGKELICAPADPRYDFTLRADAEEAEREAGVSGRLRRGDLVIVKPLAPLGENFWQGMIVAGVGSENTVAAQEMLVKIAHQAPTEFPPGALAEADALPENPRPEDWEGREDLRSIPFVTIDGADARDFDDAVFVRKEQGGFLLYVAIADVSHYVPARSALDKEAYLRGNSWYFPSSVEPMLPEALSNGLCSLKPHVPRLAVVVEIHFDQNGRTLSSRFFPTVISSAARLTYEQVGAFLKKDETFGVSSSGGTESGPESAPQTWAEKSASSGDPDELPPEIMEMLRVAARLSALLSVKRRRKGTLDFDLPEAEYEIDERGGLVAIKTRERNQSHLLIENFMIAANEAVAVFLSGRGVPFLFRIHPEPDPDRIEDFFKALARTGLSVPEQVGGMKDEGVTDSETGNSADGKTPDHRMKGGGKQPSASDLPIVLRAFKGTDQEFLVGRMALRSMPKALYHPFNSGHFGLALRDYCHFTSPIRRYADLVVHRALKYALGFDSVAPPTAKRLLEIAERINHCELSAAEAEREMLRRMGVLALHSRVGESFSGTVSGVNDFGIFVLLDEMPVEGMVHVENLGDDFYEYDPEAQELIGVGTGRRFSLGLKVETRLAGVNRGRLEINLELIGGGIFGRRQIRAAGAFGNGGRNRTAKRGSSETSRKTGRSGSKSATRQGGRASGEPTHGSPRPGSGRPRVGKPGKSSGNRSNRGRKGS